MQELEAAKTLEEKRIKELEVAKAAEEKRIKELEAAKAANDKRLKDQEIAKQQEAERVREEHAQSEKRRKEQTERARKQADAAIGSGNANSSGSAAQITALSAKYKAKVENAIRPNISSIKELSAGLAVEIEVHADGLGKIMSKKIAKSSGDAYWDSAALNAIEKTDRLPLDENGRVPSPMIITLRPRD